MHWYVPLLPPPEPLWFECVHVTGAALGADSVEGGVFGAGALAFFSPFPSALDPACLDCCLSVGPSVWPPHAAAKRRASEVDATSKGTKSFIARASSKGRANLIAP